MNPHARTVLIVDDERACLTHLPGRTGELVDRTLALAAGSNRSK
jgi:hypothetical protein